MDQGVDLVEKLGEFPWWVVAPAGKPVIQGWVFVSPGKAALSVSKCVG